MGAEILKIEETIFEEVKIITPEVHGDHRGFFMESYNSRKLMEYGIDSLFIQDNHSLSKEAGTIRGLHYQMDPHAQTKLVRVVTGAVYDVVVDIRRGSPTFGQWTSVELSGENRRMLLVPAGFAHGFCTLQPNTHVEYKVDAYYQAASDRGIRWDDPELSIAWPVESPILSQKDEQHPCLRQAEINYSYTTETLDRSQEIRQDEKNRRVNV